MAQYSKVIPGHDDILVRNLEEVRDSRTLYGQPCGDGKKGGDIVCAAKHFEREDGNPAKQVNEKFLREELLTNGPVSGIFTVRSDFFHHLRSQTKNPYHPNLNATLKGTYATTVIGYGVSEDGKLYWKCKDSNVSPDGKFYEYNIEANDKNLHWRTVGNVIKNPIPFKPVKQTEFHLGVWEAVEPEDQHWNGVLPFDYEKSGATDLYNEWLRNERNE